MTITEIWKRNEPDTICGESITLTIIYSSFKKEEIDNLEAQMPKGVVTGSTDQFLKTSN